MFVEFDQVTCLSCKRSHCFLFWKSFGRFVCAEVDFLKFMPVDLSMATILDNSLQSFFHEISFSYRVFQFCKYCIQCKQLKTVFGFAFSLLFLPQTVFSACCVCSKQDMWRHGEIVAGDFCVAAIEELQFYNINSSKKKGRKWKICVACRG